MQVERSKTPRSKQIDILRAVAVFLVLGRHMAPCPASVNGFLHSLCEVWNRGGWIGVDLFFVLSGFLVSGLLFREHEKSGSISVKHFLIRRGLKIYPSFWILIIVSLAVSLIRHHPLDFAAVLSEFLFVQNYGPSVFGHTWSLAIEEHFYLLLAGILFVLTARRTTAKPFSAIPAIFIVLALGCLGMRVQAWMTGLFEFKTHLCASHLRLDSLFLGVLISYFYHYYPSQFMAWAARYRTVMLSVGALMLLPAFVFKVEDTPFIYTVGVSLFAGGSGLILIALLAMNMPNHQAVSTTAYLGSHSYSIYLWHTSVSGWMAFLLAEVFSKHWNWYLHCTVYLVGSVCIGVLMSISVEFPVLRFRDRWFPSKGRPLSTAAPTSRLGARFNREARVERIEATQSVEQVVSTSL